MALAAVIVALDALPLLTTAERTAALMGDFGDELTPITASSGFDGMVRFVARTPLDAETETARGLAALAQVPSRLAALAVDAETLPRVPARQASVQPMLPSSATSALRSPSPTHRTPALSRVGRATAGLIAAAGLGARAPAADRAPAVPLQALVQAPGSGPATGRAGSAAAGGAATHATTEGLLLPVGWLGGSLDHLADGARRATDYLRVREAIFAAVRAAPVAFERLMTEAMAKAPTGAVDARPAAHTYVVEDWPRRAVREFVLRHQQAELLAEAQRGAPLPSWSDLTDSEFAVPANFDTVPQWMKFLVQASLHQRLLAVAREAMTRALRMPATDRPSDSMDWAAARLLNDGFYRRVVESMLPLHDANYGAATPSGKLWKAVAAGTVPTGWLLRTPEGADWAGVRGAGGTSKKRKQEGPPGAAGESISTIVAALHGAAPARPAAASPWPSTVPPPAAPQGVGRNGTVLAPGARFVPPTQVCETCGVSFMPAAPLQKRCTGCNAARRAARGGRGGGPATPGRAGRADGRGRGARGRG